MHTYPLDKPGYFLFQDSASTVSYACERIIWKWNEYESTCEVQKISRFYIFRLDAYVYMSCEMNIATWIFVTRFLL